MVKNRIQKSVSFLGLALLVASSLSPVLSGPREDSLKKTFSVTKKEANAQQPLTDAEAVYAVSEAYGPKKRNLYEVFDEIIARRAAPPAAVAPKTNVPTPEELEAGRKSLRPVEPMVGPMPETETEAFQRQLAEAKANLRSGKEVEAVLSETENAAFERQLAEAKANLRSGNKVEAVLPETEKAAFERQLAEAKANLRKVEAAPMITLEQEITQAGGAMKYTRALWEQAKEMRSEMMTFQENAARAGKENLRQRITDSMGNISHRISIMTVAKSDTNYVMSDVVRDKQTYDDSARILNEIKSMFLGEPL